MLSALLQHPEELLPLVRLYIESKKAKQLPSEPNLSFCYKILISVSRSFAIVIQQLPNPLRDAICIFYLVLRALDTIEDDMAIPVEQKLPALLDFYNKIYDREYKMLCGTGHYKLLMKDMHKMVDAFLALDKTFREVITDITKRMGAGMAKFIEKEVVTIEEYDEYCHYVAGLVGLGLSRLFVSAGLETGAFLANDKMCNEMGLFLQKTNIIRDYLEDIMEEPAPRMFWPKEVWGQYAAKLDDFKEPANRKKAIQCLNHMVSNALQHVPACLAYMSGLCQQKVFRFCAIPQVMACATLALCYNNGKVFEGVVKMRRGRTAFILDNLNSMADVHQYFIMYLHELEHKAQEVEEDDPTKAVVLKSVQASIQLCEQDLNKMAPPTRAPEKSILQLLALLICAIYFFLAYRSNAGLPAGGYGDLLKALSDNLMLHKTLSALLFMLCMAYVFG